MPAAFETANLISLWKQGLDTDAPRLRLADGAEFVGAWEENVGTSVVFAEPAGEERAARYAGHAEWTLVMRRRTS